MIDPEVEQEYIQELAQFVEQELLQRCYDILNDYHEWDGFIEDGELTWKDIELVRENYGLLVKLI